MSIDQLLRMANANYRTGQFRDAERLYRAILQLQPDHPEASRNLALLAPAQGRPKQFGAVPPEPSKPPSVSASPPNQKLPVEVKNDMRDLMVRSPRAEPGRNAEAPKKSAELLHRDAVTLNNQGNILREQGRLPEAEASYRRALAFNPDYAEAHYNLGFTLGRMGRLAEAGASYQRAVEINPDYTSAHNNLGFVLQGQGRLAEAEASFRRVLELEPGLAMTRYNLGVVLGKLGRFSEAEDSYKRALEIKPDIADAYNNLGVIFNGQGRLVEAEASYKRALGINPYYAEAHVNLGNVLRDLGKLDDALASYRRALGIKPDYAKAYSNLLYLHAFTRDISPEAEYELAARWENTLLNESERNAARNRALAFRCPARAGRKLRLGIVSAELGQHAVAEFLEPFLEQLDRSRFHVSLYPTLARLEPKAERIKGLADEYKPLMGLPDSKAAELIQSDRIDILIDTTGHMESCRLGIFAHRAAPVQCHYIGYHGTTGLSEMDWFIADEVLLPAACDSHFREKIWRLPRLWIAYRGDTSLPASNWKPDADGTVWLGSFNNLTKVREQTLALWARVMNALPESKLLLKDNKSADPAVQQRIRTELARYGVSGERVEFAAWASGWSSHMALYDRLDIALDTIPLNSGTTAFDALWMGVPLIALEGDWMGGRMTGAMLNALGKPEWVARDEDEYVAIVAALARDVAGREKLRANQRTLMASSPLCDAKGLAGSLENAFEAMFDQWLSKKNARPSITHHAGMV